jgi:tRNA A37 threonylcarbamoyladenosine synthetase subunit TsaC/SUA5/YrdC
VKLVIAVCPNNRIYFFPESLLIKKMINPITAATANIPTQTPALKISPTNWQLVKEIEIITNNKT